MEHWKHIAGFPKYEVSDLGNVRSVRSGNNLSIYANQYGVACVGLMRDGQQYSRSVALLVANAFIVSPYEAFDTPINVNGDRFDNHTDNLQWRPRHFAVKYNRQFREPYDRPIVTPVRDVQSGVVSPNSFECARTYGLLEKEVVQSIVNYTYAWPTYQRFELVLTDS